MLLSPQLVPPQFGRRAQLSEARFAAAQAEWRTFSLEQVMVYAADVLE